MYIYICKWFCAEHLLETDSFSINQSEYFIYPQGQIVSLQLLLVSIEVKNNNNKQTMYWRGWSQASSQGNGVWEVPPQITHSMAWAQRPTDPFLHVNVSRITPAVVDERSESPSFTLAALGGSLKAWRPQMETLWSGVSVNTSGWTPSWELLALWPLFPTGRWARVLVVFKEVPTKY